MSKQSTGNPFLDMDFTKMDMSKFDISKMMSEFKVPGVDMEGMMSSHRRNIEAVVSANQTAMEGMQTAMRRQAEIMKEMVEASREVMTQLMSSGAPEDKVAQQADAIKTAFEKTLTHLRELSDMLAKSNTEAAEKLTKRVTEQLDEIKTAAAKLKK